jgi:hypothetical protein
MLPKGGYRFPAFAKPRSAGEGSSDEIMSETTMAGGVTQPGWGEF